MTNMRLVVLTGASGSGKTAIADAIRTGWPALADVLHFDRIGVPSPEAMAADWGSGEAWQRAMSLEWMVRIAAMRGQTRPVLFEGQMRLAFLREGLTAAGIVDFHVVLVDCDDATRVHRLVASRMQPELANPEMLNWAAHLRREARDGGYEVLDASQIPLADSVAHVRVRLAGPT
jgi:hypothetical protein